MDYTEMTKQVVDFQKMSFANWYSAATMVQDQAASAMNVVLNQSTWIPAEGRNAVQSWLDACQTEQDRFKAYIDKSFSSMEKYVGKSKKTAPAKEK